jgi:hypothetical protein
VLERRGMSEEEGRCDRVTVPADSWTLPPRHRCGLT